LRARASRAGDAATAAWNCEAAGAFWLHLAQNHFALSYVNTLWYGAQGTWPAQVAIQAGLSSRC
jgi:hypothetical protein